MHHGSLAPGFQVRKLRSISNANPTGGIKACDNAAFGLEPQGYGMANRLAYGPVTAGSANSPSKRSQYGGIVASGCDATSRNRGHILCDLYMAS
jgi:hypothetical protein